MNISKAEDDFLSDLAYDSHGIWEWPQFIRLHYPDIPLSEVTALARSRLLTWINEGWIELSTHETEHTEIKNREELILYIQSAKLTGFYSDGDPRVDLTEQKIKQYKETGRISR